MNPAWLVLLAFAGPRVLPLQQAPAKAVQVQNPYAGQEDAIKAGAKLFHRDCATCHGRGAEGYTAPPLNSRIVREAAPGALFWVLRNGSIMHGMPSFSHLPDEQRWQIVTYLKSLGR